jgi:hypothetical protein
MSVQQVQPDYRLTVSSDAIAIVGDEPAEVKVSVERRHGFKSPIDISLVGLPDAVSAEPVVSESEGDSAKAVQLKLVRRDGTYSGVIQIRGVSRGDSSLERWATFSIPRPAREVDRMWLTVAASK